MKFRFPIVIIDEDYRSDNTSGLGIRALADAIESEGFEVLGVTSYGDLSQFAQQQSRASAFILSIDDEEFGLDEDTAPIIHSLRSFIGQVRRKNDDVPIYLHGETKTSQPPAQRHPARAARLHPYVRGHARVRGQAHHPRGQELPGRRAATVLQGAAGLRRGRLVFSGTAPATRAAWRFLKSPVGQMYHQFYGENMLRADVCNAVEELGQLLDHNGAIGESERNAARIFNADHCFFVTNGTSTSNKMVWHHTVAPGDVVVVDRNCHKSILHSIIMTGAIPVFLKPTRNHFGIIGPIPQSEFEPESIQAKIAANPLLKGVDAKSVKPRVLTLTQSTYDGVLYNTETIKGMLDGYVDNLHFDEAWLPHAAFHPFYGSYHAMGKKRARPKHSVVYATQSIHKLLAGISQASHVLVQDSQTEKLDQPPVQRGVPDAHLDQPAVQHHRQLRCGRRHDGAARRHRAGGREAFVEALNFRRAMRKVEDEFGDERLVVRRSGAPKSWWTKAWAVRRTGSFAADATKPRPRRAARIDNWHGFGATGRRLQHAGPDQVHHRHARPGPGWRLCRHRHSRLHRHQIPGRARRGGGEDGPVQLLHHVHHRHHQGPLEHAC